MWYLTLEESFARKICSLNVLTCKTFNIYIFKTK